VERKLYIDGRDAYRYYDVFVTDGGCKDLAKFPSLKKVDCNKWHEDDGEETDLSAVYLDSKEISITFAAHKKQRVDDFINVLSQTAYHEFDFREIQRKYRLRMMNQENLWIVQDLYVFTLKFIDDFPVNDAYEEQPPPNP
jgi:hypothetical protein